MRRKLLVLVLFMGVLALLYVLGRQSLSMEYLVAQETQLRRVLDRHPVAGFAVGFAIYLALCFVPGLGGKAVIVGWLYGFWQALVMVNVGLTITAVLTFWFSRYVFKDCIESRYGSALARINRGLRRDGAFYLFTARVLHVPFSATNYLLGATRIRSRSFWLATQAGILPGNILFVYAGDRLPSLEQLAEEGVASIFTPDVVVALIALIVIPLAIQFTVRRLLARRARSRE